MLTNSLGKESIASRFDRLITRKSKKARRWDSSSRGLLIFLLVVGWVVSSTAHAQAEGNIVPPWQDWKIDYSNNCNNKLHTFGPSANPIGLLQEFVQMLDETCAGSTGASYIVTHTLNTCTPAIDVYSNGVIGRSQASMNGCTYTRHVNPKPGCAPAWACQPYTQVHPISSAAPNKRCQAPNDDGTRAEIALTGPPSYAECKCPAGSKYAVEVAKCLPHIPQTLKPEEDLCVSNPIHPATGNKRQIEVDYVGTGPAPLTFTRTYNSAADFKKWRSNYDLDVDYYSSGTVSVATLNRPEGSYPFTGRSATPDADVEYRLLGSNGSYTVFSPDGRRREYYNTANKLQSVRNARGTLLYTLTYSTASTPATIAPTSGLLITVSNAFGQTLSLTYDAQSRLKTMTDPGGGVTQYAYDSQGNIASVTRPDGRIRQYLYNEPAYTQGADLPYALTGIIDEENSRFATFGYDAGGKAILTEHAGGADRHSVTYSTRPELVLEVVRDSQNVPRYVRSYYLPPKGVILTDPLGHARQYSFVSVAGSVRTTGANHAGNGQCSAVPAAQSFDTNGNISSRTDFNGVTSNYTFDLSRNIEISRTEAAGTSSARMITTQWNSSSRWPILISTYAGSTATGTPKRHISLSYDSGGMVTTRAMTDTTLNETRTSTYTYTTYDQPLTQNGPRTDVSDVTTYTYYACATGFECGQIATITNAQNQTTTFNTYNAHGQPLTITDPNGLVTTLTYDLRQRLTSRTVGTETTTFEYWPTGLLKKATLPDGSFIAYTYDAAHRLVQVADDEGNRVDYTLDAMGNRLREDMYDPASALTNTRTRVFNTLNRLTQEIGAANTSAVTTTLGYDAQGNETSVSAPLGRNTTQTYDPLNRLSQVTDPASGVTQYGYNALDQLLVVRGRVRVATSSVVPESWLHASPRR